MQVDELPGYTKVDAAHGRWPQDGFCQVAYLRDGSTSSYQLSVDMYNFIGRDGVNFGHPGVLLNAEDQDNYDFVYFRFVAIYTTSIRRKLSLLWFQTWATIWIFQNLLTTIAVQGWGGGGVLGLIFAKYVLLASQSPYPIIVYSLANYRPHLSHFWANVIVAIPTKQSLSIMYLPYIE